jgi:uncharacterized membrane protein YfcA
MSTEQLLVALVTMVATFVQAGAGFGMALFAMPFLVLLIGVRTATPMMSILSITSSIILLTYYRTAFNFRAVMPLIIGALIGVPLGVYVLKTVDPTIVTPLLGVILIAYAIYALVGFTLPQLNHKAWGYLSGFAGGLLGGAYATNGPPVIIYGNCRRWDRDQFKSNLQGFFLFAGALSVVSHAVAGNYTPKVWQNLWVALPAALIGLALGVSMDRFINQDRFRQLVQVLLIFLGIGLIL